MTTAAPLVISPNDGAAGGTYTLDVVAAANVTLQSADALGWGWRDVVTITAPGGMQGPILVPQGAVLRLNPAADTTVSYSLGQAG